MKKKIIAVAAVAIFGIASISCTKQQTTKIDTFRVNDGEPCKLTLGVGALESKLSFSASDDEKKINNVKYYVFDTQTLQIESFCESTEDNGKVEVSLLPGEKDIWVVVNSSDTVKVTDSDSFVDSLLDMTENEPDNLLMTGFVNTTLYTDSNIKIEVERMAAKVVVNQITTDFTAPVYSGGNFTIKSLYLQSVAQTIQIDGYYSTSNWLNAPYLTDTYDGMLGEEDIDMTLNGNTSQTLDYVFFSSPSTSGQHMTCLVMEAELNGVDMYYRVPLPVLKRNKIYTVTNLTITRPGYSSPEFQMELSEFSIDISVKDWTTGEDVSYVI